VEAVDTLAKGAKKAAAENQAGQEAAAKYAIEGSYPYNVAGSLGGVKFDNEGKAIGLGLSETFQKQQDAMISSADANRAYLAGIEADPLTAENRYYEQQMALLRPEQEAEREALDAQLIARGMLGSTGGMGQMQGLREAQDAQLIARGMLGSTGGMGQMQGLREAQGTTNLQVRQSASDRVQDMIDRYRGRISEDVSGAATLGQLSGAALTSANATMGRYGGMGNALRGFKGFGSGNATGYSDSGQRTSQGRVINNFEASGAILPPGGRRF